MAFIIPVVSAFSAVSAAGGLAAAMGTVGGFLSVAGGVLAGVGAITGKNDLVKLGGLMSLGGGLANSAGNGALSAGEKAAEGAARESFRASEIAAQNAGLTAAKTATDIGSIGQQAAQQVSGLQGAAEAAGAALPEQGASLMDKALSAQSAPSIGQQLTASAPMDAVAQAGAETTSSQLQSILGSAWDKTKNLAGGAGDFVKQNPELVKLGAGVVQGLYGPEAEQMDWQRSILQRRLRNLNSPVRLANSPGG